MTMIEINLSKLERGTHEGRVKVTRGGKTFWRKQRVGRKEDVGVGGSFEWKGKRNSDNYKDMALKTKLWILENKNRQNEFDAVYDYTLYEYEEINKSLREEISEDKIDGKISNISSFINNAPKFTGITYKGVSFNLDNSNEVEYFKDFMKNFDESKEIEFKPFMSTTIRKEKAIEFTDINAPKSMNFMNLCLKLNRKMVLHYLVYQNLVQNEKFYLIKAQNSK